jgi:hypothetical protein
METNVFAARLAAVGTEIEAKLDALIGFSPRPFSPQAREGAMKRR